MGTCAQCGVDVDTPFTCSHCGQTYCGNHRLPENHDCPMQATLTGQSETQTKSRGHGPMVASDSGVEEPEPMDLGDNPSPSSSSGKEPPKDSSPDVELKESRQRITNNENIQSSIGWIRSALRSLQVEGHIWRVTISGMVRNTVRFVGLVVVVLTAYNLLAAPFLATAEYAPYRVLLAPLFGSVTILSDILLMTIGACVTWFI